MAHSGEIEKLERRWMDNPTGLSFAPLAEAYRRAGDHPRALEVLELGLAQHAGYVPALIVQARCHLDARLDGEAEASFNAVLASDPHNLIALKGLADLCELTDRLPESSRYLERLLDADPTHLEAAQQREKILARLGEREALRTSDHTEAPPEARVEGLQLAEALEVELDRDPAAGLQSLLNPVIEHSETDPLAPIDVSAAPADVPPHASAETELVLDKPLNPFADFDPAGWDLPFSEVAPPSRAFDEGLSLAEAVAPTEPSPEAPAMEAGTDAIELPSEAPEAILLHDLGAPAPEAEVAEVSAPAAEPDPVGGPIHLGAEAQEAEVSAGLRSPALDAEAEREVAGATEAEPGVLPEAAEEATSEGAEAVDDTAPDEHEAGHAAPAAETAPAVKAEPVEPVVAVAEPDPVVDLRLEGEEYQEVEAGWMASTDWSDPMPPAAASDDHPSGHQEASAPAEAAAPVAEVVITAGTDEPVVAPEDADPVSVVEGAFDEFPVEAAEPAAEVEPEMVITETMAEVFLRQGLRPLALAVYAQLLERDPGNQRLHEAVARLRGELLDQAVAASPVAAAQAAQPEEPIGTFLARVLGPEQAEPAPAPRPAAEPESSGPLSGRPTRPAEDPSLSLSTIFGEEVRRSPGASAGSRDGGEEAEPSFDEFFGHTGVPAGAGGDEAELEQFNAWLRSLQR